MSHEAVFSQATGICQHALAPRAPERLDDPLTNKGTAYSRDERIRYGLDGLLPPRVESLQEQSDRVIGNVRPRTSPLDQYRYLSAVQRENETLFYRVILDHLEETLPIIYTPTVGQACLEWSRIRASSRAVHFRSPPPRACGGSAPSLAA